MKSVITRYLMFITGLWFLSVGVVLIVNSSLGTTPISCFNYVISVNTPLSLGTATFLFNMLLIAIEFLLIRGIGTRKDTMEILLQLPFSFLFAAFIDLSVWMLSGLHPTSYLTSLMLLGAGLLFQGIGVVLELKPDVAIMSAEGVVKYASRRYRCEFGKMKIGFDIVLVLSAVTASLIMAHRIDGVREGTLIAAVLTGFIVSFLSRHIMTRANAHRLGTILPLRLLRF